jgi:hypothetical protein
MQMRCYDDHLMCELEVVDAADDSYAVPVADVFAQRGGGGWNKHIGSAGGG